MNKKLASLSVVGMLLISATLPFAAFAENNGRGAEMKDIRATVKTETKLNKEVDDLSQDLQGFKDGEAKGGGMQPSVILGPNGGFRLTGVHVNSVDSTGMMLSGQLYGFSKDVSVAGAEFHANGGATIALSDIHPGDTIVVRGTWDASTHAINVKYIRDLSVTNANGQATSQIQSRINELLQMVAALQAKLQGLAH